MWQVNMTGKMKGWSVNSPISPDIVHWPGIILSPASHLCHWLKKKKTFLMYSTDLKFTITFVSLLLFLKLLKAEHSTYLLISNTMSWTRDYQNKAKRVFSNSWSFYPQRTFSGLFCNYLNCIYHWDDHIFI